MFEEVTWKIDEEIRKYGSLKEDYNERKPILDKILAEMMKEFAQIKLKHQKNGFLRIAYIDGRIKSLSGIIKKACEKDIKANYVFNSINDILGLRIVVNNQKDIELLIHEIDKNLKFKIHEREEHEDDYKALHLLVSYSRCENNKPYETKCEIQIRTLLQDAWAILTHHDVYKNQQSLPLLAKPISDHLSQSLNTIDHLADNFRQQIETIVEPPNDLSDEASLDRQGIAFLYYDLLGKKPQEYEVDYLNRKVAELGIQTVGQARKGLNKDVIKQLEKIHDIQFPPFVPEMDLLEYGILYSAKGPLAFKEYRKHIKSEWEEIEQYGRAETLSGLPETFDELLEMIRKDEVPWEAIRELGGIEECIRCSTDIFDSETAAEAILEHYEYPDNDEDLEGLLFDLANNFNCPFEPVSVNNSRVCPYCDHMMSKDD